MHGARSGRRTVRPLHRKNNIGHHKSDSYGTEFSKGLENIDIHTSHHIFRSPRNPDFPTDRLLHPLNTHHQRQRPIHKSTHPTPPRHPSTTTNLTFFPIELRWSSRRSFQLTSTRRISAYIITNSTVSARTGLGLCWLSWAWGRDKVR